MMTSVTLPSSSGIHGGYSSAVSGEETASNSVDEFESPRSVKRCLSTIPSADPCKKRRKQSTPIRISAAEMNVEQQQPHQHPPHFEGKPSAAVTPEPDHRCHVCQLYFDTLDQLQNHLVSDHSVDCKKEIEDFSPTSTPTPFEPIELTMPRTDVSWINEQMNKDWKGHSLSNLSFGTHTPNPNMFMTLPQFVHSDSIPRQPIRIFNPDAYCDLCNKEFCNKYFLKTHKANKHGIYTDTPATEPTISNCVNIPTFTSGNIKPLTSVPSVEFPFNIKTETKIQSTIVMNPFSETYSLSNIPKASMPAAAKPNIVANVGATTTASFESASESNENQNSNGFTFPIPASEIKTEFEIKKTTTSCDEPRTEESSSPNIIPTESTSFKNDLDNLYYEQSKMSPGQQSRELDLSNRLRKIGVMNPKAFCEICCKEYCNKYFLRTHKMKRHGIFIPDDRDKDMKMEFGNFTWQHNMQTSPLNLIMTEQSSSDRKTTSPNDISCELCGIKFQNASLAQLHNISVHGKMPQSTNAAEQSSDSCDENNLRKSDASNSAPNDKSPLNAEAISEDLQKLQTMILQLNDLDVNKGYRSCTYCNKEFENRFFLHAHMMSEHGSLLEDLQDPEKVVESEHSSNNNTMCDLTINKDSQNADEIKNHLLEFQPKDEPNKEEYSEFSTPDKGVNRIPTIAAAGPLSERRISMNVTPTSSYCEICNKELCNKYFMKTHMQRMHGIEIENGAQIGGVVCDICNKELCSKYFLRVHKHNTHGIVEYGSSLLQPRKSDGEPPPTLLPPEPDTALKPADLADLSHRYFSHFTEVCTICSRRFRSTKWLKAHLLSDHGQVGAEKWAELEQQLQLTIGHSPNIKQAMDDVKVERTSPTIRIPNGSAQEMLPRLGIQNVLSSLFGVDESNAKTYQCSFCSFTTPLLPLLFVHERSHNLNSNGEMQQLKCPACPQTFLQAELLQHHLFTQHPFLPLPPFFNGNNNTPGEGCKENVPSENVNTSEDEQLQNKMLKNKKVNKKIKRLELSPEIGQSLKDVAKKAQLPASYALPQSQNQSDQDPSCNNPSATQGQDDASNNSGYVMQAFLLEESAPERRVVPSVVFLPVVQKQPAPLTVTFTLTPA